VRADAGNDVTQVGLGLDAVERCGADQRVEESRSLASGIAAGEQPVLSSNSYGPDGVLGRIVADLQSTAIEVAGQRRPSRAGITDGTGEIALAGDALKLCIEPGRQLVEPRSRQALANAAPLLGSRADDQPLDQASGKTDASVRSP